MGGGIGLDETAFAKHDGGLSGMLEGVAEAFLAAGEAAGGEGRDHPPGQTRGGQFDDKLFFGMKGRGLASRGEDLDLARLDAFHHERNGENHRWRAGTGRQRIVGGIQKAKAKAELPRRTDADFQRARHGGKDVAMRAGHVFGGEKDGMQAVAFADTFVQRLGDDEAGVHQAQKAAAQKKGKDDKADGAEAEAEDDPAAIGRRGYERHEWGGLGGDGGRQGRQQRKQHRKQDADAEKRVTGTGQGATRHAVFLHFCPYRPAVCPFRNHRSRGGEGKRRDCYS